MLKKNGFRVTLLLALGFTVFACSAADEQSQGLGTAKDLTEPIAKDHPCYDTVGRADEGFMQIMASPVFADQEPLALPESMLGMDSTMVYAYIMDSEYRKGSSLKEIRQAILEKCIVNKGL